MSRRIFWLGSAIYLVVLLIVFNYFSSNKRSEGQQSYPVEELPPIATVEYLNPTKDFPRGSLEIYQYEHGRLKIDRRYNASGGFRSRGLFAEINIAWPNFGFRDEYFSSNKDSRIRIMFELRRNFGEGFQDIYQNVVDDLNAFDGRDYSYNGFVGFRRRYGWVYIASSPSLITPQGTPLTILCSDPMFNLMHSDGSLGRCRFSLIYDENLSSGVQFNESLMEYFPELYRDLDVFLQSVKESD
ncbi:hypothetical protein BTJ40_15530 [Microbulbifer sp. A4B17]|uniref:hypothetical protein n=1 Tax=Microbulbifer sp. A4B17 TaxID=359370 RepID=UPI000D52E5BD|nr:hypothetical protein [Microbulbifer sp. A4B17]AWF82129.1 hypothetical protein BTJ40_15530 [Microbulbifer sp. A4B17]